MRSFRLSRPILDLETRNPRELAHIPSHKRQIMHQSDCCDLQIIRADHAASYLEIVANCSIPLCHRVIERKREISIQQVRELCLPLLRTIIFFCSVKKFRPHCRATCDFFFLTPRHPAQQGKMTAFQHSDPDIGIEEIGHHMTFANGKGSSSISPVSTSAHAPIRCAISGIRRLISSILKTSSSSAEAIASRTFSVNHAAFSAGKLLSKKSNSFTIAFTSRNYHARPPFPIQFFPTQVSTDHSAPATLL